MSKPENNNIVNEYLQLTQEYKGKYGENTVVLLQVGSFFEIYALKSPDTSVISGSNLVHVCQICNLNYAEKKICIGKDNVIMAGVRDYMLEKYLKILTENNYTVAVFVQDKSDVKITRVLHAIYSSGTYVSFDTDISPKISNNIMCIWIEKIKPMIQTSRDSIVCGISIVDIFTGESYIFEYQIPYILNPTTFDELERCISVYNPNEVIFISPFDEFTKNTIMQYAGINNTNISIINPSPEKIVNCEKQIYINKILSSFFGDDCYHLCSEFSSFTIATQSLCFLLDFIQEHNPNLIKKLSIPTFINNLNRIVLANHTLQQLNIIDDNVKNVGHMSSVSSFLNKCCTSMGRRLFQYQLTNPTSDIEWLNSEYNIISLFLLEENFVPIELLRRQLPQIRDIEKICRQLLLKKVYPNTIYHLHNSINIIKSICISLKHISEIKEYLSDYENIIEETCSQLLEFIDKYLCIEDCKNVMSMSTFETNIIHTGVSTELDYIIFKHNQDKNAFKCIRELLNNWMRIQEKDNKGTDYVKCHETEKSGCSLQITKKRGSSLKLYIQKLLKDNVDGHIMIESCNFNLKDIEFRNISSNLDEIHFPQLDGICKRVVSIEDELNKEISNVYNLFLTELEELFFNKLENLAKYVAKIDVIVCKTHISKKYNYCRPEIDSGSLKSFVDLKDLRHCLIEHINQNELYVTNDLSLGVNQDGILLYGTNAVGKTSMIRALGISVIMAQSGMFVPCSKFVYKPYTAIYSRILGNDNLFKGLSTFAVEMSELRVILKNADENSLILGDEICSGTETVSALSIFVTTLEHLYNIKSSFVFATHFHEIVNYEEVLSLTTLKLYHLSVSYNRELDSLVYDRKLRAGPGDSNYGLIVAKSLYLPDAFLEKAYSFRSKHFSMNKGELSNQTTAYNSKKIRGLCELCKNEIAEEIHHIIPQKLSNENGFINNFHKNHPANLQGICNTCHTNLHKKENETDIPKMKKKTTKGYIVI